MLRKWRPGSRLTTCGYTALGSKGTENTAAHGNPLPVQWRRKWRSECPALLHGLWDGVRHAQETPAGAWQRGCGKPWGAQTPTTQMPCHSLTERSQNMLAATHASILTNSKPQLRTHPASVPHVRLSATSPNPKTFPRIQSNTAMHAPGRPASCAALPNNHIIRAHAKRGARAQAEHATLAGAAGQAR